jgi:hypothetical protein
MTDIENRLAECERVIEIIKLYMNGEKVYYFGEQYEIPELSLEKVVDSYSEDEYFTAMKLKNKSGNDLRKYPKHSDKPKERDYWVGECFHYTDTDGVRRIRVRD